MEHKTTRPFKARRQILKTEAIPGKSFLYAGKIVTVKTRPDKRGFLQATLPDDTAAKIHFARLETI